MTTRRRRPRGELRRFRRDLVAVLRDAAQNASAPAGVETGEGENQRPHGRTSQGEPAA